MTPTLPDITANAILGTGAGRVLITACGRDEKSWFEPEAPATIFTAALLQRLQDPAMPNRNGGISLYDLYPALYDAIVADVKQRYNSVQQPQLTVQQARGSFLVALHPTASTAPTSLDLPNQPVPSTGAVRTVSAEESRSSFQQVSTGNQNTQIGTVSGGTVNSGNTINTGGGANIGGGVNTGGGAFTGRGSGTVNVSGGTVYGPVTGVNSGSMTTNYGTTPTAGPPDPLQQAIDSISQAIDNARRNGNNYLAEDLSTPLSNLQSAQSAGQRGNSARRMQKLNEARTALQALASTTPSIQTLVAQLDQIS